MRKVLLLVVVGVVVLLSVFFGPGLWSYFRFDRDLAAAERSARADAGPWPRLVDECAECHGPHGASQSQRYASLAGQPAPYVADQLHAFARGKRSSAPMEPLSLALSEAEISNVAAYYERQRLVGNAGFVGDPESTGRGKVLAETQGCGGCHGAALLGQERRPRLAGQSYEYLVSQLTAFRTGARVDPTGAMNLRMANLSAGDVVALAQYIASMKAPDPPPRP